MIYIFVIFVVLLALQEQSVIPVLFSYLAKSSKPVFFLVRPNLEFASHGTTRDFGLCSGVQEQVALTTAVGALTPPALLEGGLLFPFCQMVLSTKLDKGVF